MTIWCLLLPNSAPLGILNLYTYVMLSLLFVQLLNPDATDDTPFRMAQCLEIAWFCSWGNCDWSKFLNYWIKIPPGEVHVKESVQQSDEAKITRKSGELSWHEEVALWLNAIKLRSKPRLAFVECLSERKMQLWRCFVNWEWEFVQIGKLQMKGITRIAAFYQKRCFAWNLYGGLFWINFN